MPLSELQRIMLETNAQRDRAEAVLASLLRAKGDLDRQLEKLNRADSIAQVTGRSAIDEAIANTRRMIEMLNRRLADVRRTLADQRDSYPLDDEPLPVHAGADVSHNGAAHSIPVNVGRAGDLPNASDRSDADV